MRSNWLQTRPKENTNKKEPNARRNVDITIDATGPQIALATVRDIATTIATRTGIDTSTGGMTLVSVSGTATNMDTDTKDPERTRMRTTATRTAPGGGIGIGTAHPVVEMGVK